MTQTSNCEPSFDSIQMKLFCALVRARNNMETIRRSLTLRLRSRRAKELDSIAFNKFKVLIPELAEYNRAGTFKRLRSRAFLNGFHNLDGYYNSLLTDENELSYLRKNLTYIGSHFFRGSVWQRLGEICRDKFATSGEETIRVWSAACSNGKEVYSILATLLDFLPAEKLDILATDYNDFALGQCLEGCYSMRTMDEIPKKYWRYIKTFKAPEPRKVDFSYRYPHPLSPTVDHIIPVAKGGHPSDLDNLQLAHRCCNREKSDKLFARVFAQSDTDKLISNQLLEQHADWINYRARRAE